MLFRSGKLSSQRKFQLQLSNKKKEWKEVPFDYANKAGFCTGRIIGCKKVKFNNKDFGVVELTGVGVSGDDVLTGNEEQLIFYEKGE